MIPESPKPSLRILITGARGMLGTDLCTELRNRGHHTIELDKDEMDITRPDHVEKIRIQDYGRMDWVINCAAYTAVDKAETEFAAANRLNGVGPGLLAIAAKTAGARFLQVSTDFVFDGGANRPITEDSQSNPNTVYGRTKLFGEQNAIKENPDTVIVRTSWLYGPNGKSFPRTMIDAWLAGKDLRVVNDQIGTPTYTADLARLLADMIEGGIPAGIYHAAGPDVMTWYDLATLAVTTYRDEVMKSDQPIAITPVSTADFPTAARRPAYSALSFDKLANLGYTPMPGTAISMAAFASRLRLTPATQ